MEGRRSRLAFLMLFAAGLLARASGQLQVISTENSQPFFNPDRITVGRSSDLVLQVRCVSQNVTLEEEGAGVRWSYRANGSEVDVGLRPFGTSQENGVLRVYPVDVLRGENATFECSDGNSTLNVTFDLQEGLFFTNPLPPSLSVFEDRLGLCQVPDIPAANVAVVNMTNTLTGTDYFYCAVSTERGTFRSRSVIILPAPSFVYEPVNITARPVNGTATAAFSCALSPAAGLVKIQWHYEMMSFGSGSGSGMGIRPGLSSGQLFNGSVGVTIVQPVDSGSSVLVLDSVGNEYEGLYSCVAVFSDGTTLNSSQASLVYNGTSLGDNDVIILAPPTVLSVTDGDTVSVPCVGSRGVFPTFSSTGMLMLPTLTQFSLNFDPITASSAGDYVCQVGDTTANFTINVTVISRPGTNAVTILRPSMTNYLPEIATNVPPFFQCPRSPDSQWLLNAAFFINGPTLNLGLISGGFYQCLRLVTGQRETDFTGQSSSDIYLLVPVVANPSINLTPDIQTFIFGEDDNVTLNCTVTGNPLPLIEWSREGVSVGGAQAATGFMETAFSLLTLNTTELGLGTHTFTCSAIVDTPTTAPLSPLSPAAVSITVDALLLNISLEPENQTVIFEDNPNATVQFNCSVVANPPPTFEWLVNGTTFQNEAGISEGELMFSSTLTLTLGEVGAGVHTVMCVAGVENATRSIGDTATLRVYTPPTFILDPQDVTVTTGDLATLNCSAQATPLPDITWIDENANLTIMDDEFFNISLSSSGDVATSQLTFAAEAGMAGDNSYRCVANNTIREVDSNAAVVTVNTPPMFIVDPQNVTVVVGDLVSLNCSAQATPPPNITWLLIYDNGTMVTIVDDDTFNITMSEEEAVTSLLMFIANSTMAGVLSFLCEANNNVTNSQSNISVVTIQSFPMFLEDPQSTIAIVGDIITLNCTAEATPILPTIIWLDRNGEEIDDKLFSISSSLPEAGNTVTSSLTFTAVTAGLENVTGNGSTFQCVARVRVEEIERNLTEESDVADLTIAGPPGSPSPVVVNDITSRTAVVAWQPSFSLIDVITYNVSVYELSTEIEDIILRGIMPVEGGVTVLNLTALLRPFRQYRVSVVAINRAGVGERATSLPFNTSEDAPEGFPNITSLSSTQLRQVSISWGTVEQDLRNGIIISYTVLLQVLSGNGDLVNTTVNDRSIILTADDEIQAGVLYNVSIAANTREGRGPFSPGVMQNTIPEAPTIPTDTPPFVVPNGIAPTTLLITLPSIPGANSGSFSHFWVIAMKRNTSFSLDRSPIEAFPDNSSFRLYSENLPFNTPYIVAEIEASRISTSTNFLLGNNTATASLNDVAGYRNGPLSPGTPYTVFVWGFPPSVPSGVVSKRQTTLPPRQYVVFSTSAFSTPTATSSLLNALAGGAVAGVVIAVILFLISLVALVIAIVLYMRWRVKAEYIPPPSRKGSMRLRDRREIILQESSTASLIKNSRADSELQQLTPDDVRLPVTVEDFPSYCKTMHANSDHLFSEEYEILQIKSPSLPHIQCSMPHNVHKNRYANINCYDESRVHLNLMPGVEGSDYINANYIDGYQRKCAYVATQGPLPNTTYDFWRMVWELNSCCVIMLTNLVEKSRAKCHQYWPEVGSLSLGDLTVMLIEVQQLAYYTIRTYRLSRGNDRREVKQFHYTGWPDFGVPDHPNPVIQFIRRLANFKRTTDGPDIIHCSAGVGRTGTLITIQTMLQQVNEEGKIDIFNFVLGMRRQRNYMVQTERQYIFLHDAMMELLKLGDTEIPIQNLRRRYKELLAQDPNTESSRMESEFMQLKELDSVDESQFQAAKMAVNLPKNRFQDILPYERYRVRLLLHPGVSGSDYVNASYIDGYQQRHQYIVTQGPLKDTVDDFWRMVWEHRASTILMLCQLEEKGKEQCVRYWPNEKIRQHGDMFVELTQVTEFATYTMREFSITNTKINESRTIRQYQYTDWLEDQNPSNAAAIIDLIGVLQRSQHNNGGGPIIVHDSTSVGRAGTFCVMGSVLEQLKVEGIVDPFFTIHSLRQQQPGLVQTFDQYKFCYQAVIEFLDSFDHYANFD